MSKTIKRTFKVPTKATPEGEGIGRIPRVAKLMALAIRFDGLIRDSVVTSQTELAEFGQVSRARVTQIMNFLNLAPDIQEEIVFLPRVTSGRGLVTERELRELSAEVDWERQRGMSSC